MTKRKITPHKGGRFKGINLLATFETYQKLNEIKNVTEESNGDLFERWVETEWAKHFSSQSNNK